MKRQIAILVVLALTAVSGVFAQTPQQFKYQAVLRDASNVIVASTAKTVGITILQGSSSGTNVYQETHSITTTAQGVINLNIGTGTVVSGTFANIPWSTNSYWVKVTVDAVEISNVPLLSVPYALNAKYSENTSGTIVPASAALTLTTPYGLATAPTTGQMVYNTGTTFGGPGMAYYDGTTWQTVNATNGTGNYIQLKMSANQSPVANGTTVAFNTTLKTNGMTSTGNGINLKAGVTYRLEAALDFDGATGGTSYLGYSIWNAAGSIGATGYTTDPTSTAAFGLKSSATTLYTPAVDETVYVKIIDQHIQFGTCNLRSDLGAYFIATDLTSSVGGASGGGGSSSGEVVPASAALTLTTPYGLATAPTTGQMIYNTGTNFGGPGMAYYDGTTWQSTGSSSSAGTGGTSNYIQLKMGASQGSVANGTIVAFNTTFKSNGMTATGNGINLKAGVTYRLETGLDIFAATDQGYLGYCIANAAGSLGSTAYAMTGSSPSADAMRNTIVMIYTPTGDETVYVKITDQRMGTGTIRSDFNPYFIATEMTSGSSGSVSGTHYLGEEYLGGIIFYLYTDNTGTQKGLIVSKTETTATWGGSTVVGADRTEDGAYNMNLMPTGAGTARTWVETLGAGWYLPSVDELSILWHNRFHVNKTARAISSPLLLNGGYYWPSLEFDATSAFCFAFYNGYATAMPKTNAYSVRGVRAF